MTTTSRPRTFLDALVQAVQAVSAYNSQDLAPPTTVLWPDEDRQWESLLPQLMVRMPLFVLGEYLPEIRTGPAYWLRCIIARTISHPDLTLDQVPVLYLPGFSRQHIRALEGCPSELKPLAELQYRGAVWNQKNGRDWTINAFLQSRDGGLGIGMGADSGTKEALRRALVRLSKEPIESLQQAAPLRAFYLDGLIHPDHVKNVLRWLDNPSGYRDGSTDEEWTAFVSLCESYYEFHPDRDGPITAAEKLGQQDGTWGIAWQRFAEAPATYGTIPDRLREARPEKTLPLLHHAESWPQDNESSERALREALVNLSQLDPNTARLDILNLERNHNQRRSWVWASVGLAPLARALEHLATMAKVTESAVWDKSIVGSVGSYTEVGWTVDLAVLEALASVEKLDDVAAVRSAVRTVYRPWLETCTEAFQDAVTALSLNGYQSTELPRVSDGTCLIFVDGLRFDLAKRLEALLKQQGISTETKAGFAALPPVTSTAKPAISPAATVLSAGEGFETVVTANGSKVNAQVLRRAIADRGFQVLGPEELGDPTGRAWVESGNIDAYGHEHGWMVAHHAVYELGRLAERLVGLLDHGWQKVVVITDHGWLLMPGGLPKADLPEHLTELRKGRCARLKEGSTTVHKAVPWHWDRSVRVATAPGIHCFEVGKEYEHGGLSPQECIVPVLTAFARVEPVNISIANVRWGGLRCNFTIQGLVADVAVDIRTRGGSPSTTLTRGGKKLGADNEAFLLVEDAAREGEPALIVVVDSDGSVLAQAGTVVGG